jgi:hypothetical protein
MSNWPPLVAMSVVTRWRSTFSSSTTQFSLMPVACSNFGASRCMMIMSELLTVAIVNVCAAANPALQTSAVVAKAAARRSFMGVPPGCAPLLGTCDVVLG